MKICSIDGCNNKMIAKGFCHKHYKRFQIHGDPLFVTKKIIKMCSIEGCNNKSKTKGLCNNHYMKLFKYGDPLFIHSRYSKKYCSIEKCNNSIHGKGLCLKHYAKFRKYGDPLFSIHESHGMTETTEYTIWRGIKSRCLNKNNKDFKNYGGRGITVCNRWLNSFIAFYEDMGPRPFPEAEIDREDNDGNYEPGNCRWVTSKVNANNRRPARSNNE